jgi:hypothetical protein
MTADSQLTAESFRSNGASQATSNNGPSAKYAGVDQVERTHSYDKFDVVYGRAGILSDAALFRVNVGTGNLLVGHQRPAGSAT